LIKAWSEAKYYNPHDENQQDLGGDDSDERWSIGPLALSSSQIT
jgi:hypothetical protein